MNIVGINSINCNPIKNQQQRMQKQSSCKNPSFGMELTIPPAVEKKLNFLIRSKEGNPSTKTSIYNSVRNKVADLNTHIENAYRKIMGIPLNVHPREFIDGYDKEIMKIDFEESEQFAQNGLKISINSTSKDSAGEFMPYPLAEVNRLENLNPTDINKTLDQTLSDVIRMQMQKSPKFHKYQEFKKGMDLITKQFNIYRESTMPECQRLREKLAGYIDESTRVKSKEYKELLKIELSIGERYYNANNQIKALKNELDHLLASSVDN